MKTSLLLRSIALLSFGALSAFASDELTVYELLAPETHSFAITYDMSTTVEGSPYLFNPIRRGSVATHERVIDSASGKELKFEVVSAADAQLHGLPGRPNADQYIQVTLARPVPHNGEARVRIFKPIPIPRPTSRTARTSCSSAHSASSATLSCCPRAMNSLIAARPVSSLRSRTDACASAL